MGWTSYQATHYKGRSVDRKAECDALNNDSDGMFRVEKSAMVGSTYYAAVTRMKKRDENGELVALPENERYTFAVIYLTQTDNKSYYNFAYKDMDESCGPYQCDCPKSILKLLSPTDNEYALRWRNDCLKKAEEKKNPNSLGKLPIGTIIELTDGTKLVKRAPAYQFKSPWWYNAEKNCYKMKKYIGEYTVISA